jgi:predicted nicotinamide N-methyase
VLASNRTEGTTGAVVWKVTPLFADWIIDSDNLLWRIGVLTPNSSVLELGCGVSAIVGLALGPQVARYVLTDQSYVGKLVARNLEENADVIADGMRKPRAGKVRKSGSVSGAATTGSKVTFRALDWELDTVDASLTGDNTVTSFDVVLALDCIYNEALIQPLVQTCADVCRLRAAEAVVPCMCIIAQQLRSSDVFDSWLQAMMKQLRVWRVPDIELPPRLRSERGFVVHLAMLKHTVFPG